jgi:hypothetical protein
MSFTTATPAMIDVVFDSDAGAIRWISYQYFEILLRLICDLLNDRASLYAERAKARTQVGRFMGIGQYDSFGSSYNTHR